MKGIFFLVILFVTYFSNAQTLTGFVDIEKIESDKHNEWFNKTYSSYEPNKLVMDSMMALPSDYKLLVFGGTWCEDTQDLLPKLYKCSDQVNISRADIALYLLDEQKLSAQGLEKKYNITNVPTFIVLKNGEEQGRITETVKHSIEQDLLDIMQ